MKVRQRARRDGNHNEIVRAVEAAGATWFDTSRQSGSLDGVIGYAGIDQRVEIKDPAQDPNKRKLSTAEQDVFDQWLGRKPVVIETIEDVTETLNRMRRDSNARVG